LSDGREITNSAAINRGFKDGYGINQTAGSNGTEGGIGGNGATGGNGGISGGGGGGSGYTDTSINVVEATLGGNNSTQTKLIMRLFEPIGDFYRDSAGRILIYSSATVGKNPKNLTVTTGRVLPGTDSCIDDVRWQNFLSLAQSNQDYRLAVTEDGKTTAVVKATSFNLNKMKSANVRSVPSSLTDWFLGFPGSGEYVFSWDDDQATYSGGVDYSGIIWSGGVSYPYGYAYYGWSSNSVFQSTSYHFGTANFWILPPGVSDFP
jgi:hypothetical protein